MRRWLGKLNLYPFYAKYVCDFSFAVFEELTSLFVILLLKPEWSISHTAWDNSNSKI